MCQPGFAGARWKGLKAGRGLASLALVGVLALALHGCADRPKPSGPSVLLIVIDTLRADHLGAYGWQRHETSPHLDEFARQALVYEMATSAAPFTMPSMAGTFTGHYPDRTGVVNHSEEDSLLLFPGSTLAEELQSAGYRTGAAVTNGWLRKDRQGFSRGFDQYHTKVDTADSVTDRAISLLEDWEDEPFFLWAHYIEPHMPYEPPSEDALRFGVQSGTTVVVQDFKAAVHMEDKQELYFHGAYPEAELDATRALYDAEIRSADREIGRLLEALDTLGRADDTIVIVMSDHGESLGDHGLYFAHDFTLYEELLHVALMVRRPGSEPGRISGAVSLIDIMPSLCSWLGLKPPDGLDGIPLPEQEPSPGGQRLLFAASAPWRERYRRYPRHHVRGIEGRWSMVRRGNMKLIMIPHPEGPEWEAYDLASDPQELVNLMQQAPSDELGSLQASLLEWNRVMGLVRPNTSVTEPLDEETLDQLRALGYVQ